jgi:hypothetical protein
MISLRISLSLKTSVSYVEVKAFQEVRFLAAGFQRV